MVEIKNFFDPQTYTLSYVVFDATTRDAVVIDPVLDYDEGAVTTCHKSLNTIVAFVTGAGLKVRWVLETHAHADHLSGARDLISEYLPGARLGISRRIVEVQRCFAALLNLPATFPTDGRQFDRLFDDDEQIECGALRFRVVPTPGHTAACVSYLFEGEPGALFTGDALFMPDYGTGRCDFPGGDAARLFDSVSRRLYRLPDATRVFVGHDYQPGGRPLAWETTIGASKAENVQLRGETSEADFVAFRRQRDKTLSAPKLLYPAIQVNLAGGRMPEPEANGRSYLKLPVTPRLKR